MADTAGMLHDGECIHGMEPDWCTLCKKPTPRAQPVDEGRVLVAKWAGTCVGCRLPIYPGQKIRYQKDVPLRHDGC